MSYTLKKNISLVGGTNNSMYLFTGHGEPKVVDKKKATLGKPDSNKIISDKLSAYCLFTVPPKIEIIFFNKLGQAHDANPCDFENVIIKTNIEDVIKTFNKGAIMTGGTEQMDVSPDDGSALGDIMYVKYVSGMKCPDLEMNMIDNIIEYGNNGIGQYYEKCQKVGLYKYPLNPNDFFINDCGGDNSLGFTAEYIYLSMKYYSHFYNKYDKLGQPIIKNNIDLDFHLSYIPTLFNRPDVITSQRPLTLKEIIKLIIIDFCNDASNEEILEDYAKHIILKDEHDMYEKKSLQGAIDLKAISKIVDKEPKVTLKDLSNHLSQIDNSEKIILLVITCRGDADMTH